MASIRCLEFLLLLLLLRQVYGEEAEPVFRAEDSAMEVGYCFGVDYMVVYRSSPEGDELLGNSSAHNVSFIPPSDLQGRISIRKTDNLLGLMISHLTHMDSGVYRRECWQNQTLVSQHTTRLSVCNEEVEPAEIVLKNGEEVAGLLCNSTSVGLEGTSVRWYREMYVSYKPTLILDSGVSLDLVIAELQGAVEVRDNGALLLVHKSLLKNNQQFYCLVVKGEKCLSFQSIYQSGHMESRDIFASRGERVVLNCSTDGNKQQWETPFGQINGSSIRNNQMYISSGDKLEDFSLVIAAVSDEHVGEYFCITPLFDMQYLLVLCPKKEPQEKVVFEGEHILLDCGAGEHDSQTVKWHRRKPSGEDELIYDSYDKTIPIPEDLRGRLTENGSLLVISHLEVKDGGVYWCVVLAHEGGNYEDDYDYSEEFTEEDESSDDEYWNDEHRCIIKQETILSLLKTTRRNANFEPVTTTERITNSTAGPPAPSHVITHAVVAGLAVLVVVAVIVAVIAVRRRASGSHREAASRSGLNTTTDREMTVDPGCTDRLTHNNEYIA